MRETWLLLSSGSNSGLSAAQTVQVARNKSRSLRASISIFYDIRICSVMMNNRISFFTSFIITDLCSLNYTVIFANIILAFQKSQEYRDKYFLVVALKTL